MCRWLWSCVPIFGWFPLHLKVRYILYIIHNVHVRINLCSVAHFSSKVFHLKLKHFSFQNTTIMIFIISRFFYYIIKLFFIRRLIINDYKLFDNEFDISCKNNWIFCHTCVLCRYLYCASITNLHMYISHTLIDFVTWKIWLFSGRYLLKLFSDQFFLFSYNCDFALDCFCFK